MRQGGMIVHIKTIKPSTFSFYIYWLTLIQKIGAIMNSNKIMNNMLNAETCKEREEIRVQVCAILMECFKSQKLDESHIGKYDLIEDLGMDSITFIYLMVTIERHFNIVISDEDMLMIRFRNVDSMVELVQRHILTE